MAVDATRSQITAANQAITGQQCRFQGQSAATGATNFKKTQGSNSCEIALLASLLGYVQHYVLGLISKAD